LKRASPTGLDPASIPELIRRLGDTEFKVRQEAADKLVGRQSSIDGLGGLPFLEE